MKVINGRLTFSATDLSAHAACAHLTELRLREHLDGGDREPRFEGPGTRALRERGMKHEREYLDHLRATGRDVLDLGFVEGDDRRPYEKISEAIERTRAAVRDRVDVIAQARFQNEVWGGSADVLLWDAASERYRIVDTKLSRETKGGTILQLLIYAELLDALAPQVTECVGVVAPGSDFKPEWHRVTEYDAYFRLAKRRLLEAVDHRPATYPDPVDHCTLCNWWQRCEAERRADDHLSLIAGITRGQRREAVAHVLPTLKAFAGYDPELWKPERGSLMSLRRAHRQAAIQLQGREAGEYRYELLPREVDAPVPTGFGMLPEPDAGDIFFDIEGDRFAGDAGLEYLFGTIDATRAYVERWAMEPKAERAMAETFIDEITARVTEHPGAHVYHYGHYEVSALKRLAQRYGTREHELDVLLRSNRFVDLLRVVKTALIASVEGYSIKQLEPLYGFIREEDLERSREYRRQLEIELEQGSTDDLPAEMLASILDYNREDCESTRQLRDWLESLRQGLADAGEQIPRPAAVESEDERPRDPDLQALIDRLLQDVPLDPDGRAPEQQARATLAALTEYHQRERRNAWWEFIAAFEREDEEDHFDAGNSIAGLRFIEVIAPEGKQKNWRLRFGFPDQRIDSFGDTAFWALDFEDGTLGKIQDLDKDRCEVLFSVKPERVDLRPDFVVVAPANIRQGLITAIQSLAASVADVGFDASPFVAAVNLLLRRPPTYSPPLGPSDPDLLEEACLRAGALERGVLAVQGPPGSGKTHTAAHQIARLVQQGKKVGVCALSHAAIGGLLMKVDEEVPSVRCEHPRTGADFTKTLANLAQRKVDVVGATSFQWCKEDARGAIDVLVIEEAGQLTLADSLAASMAAPRVIMLGDPQQLEAPQQGSHPEGSGSAALAHFIGGYDTIQEDLGLFITKTRRLAGPIASFTSDLFYEGRLEPLDDVVRCQVLEGDSPYAGAGMFVVNVDHTGNQSHSPEEVEKVAELVEHLTTVSLEWRKGTARAPINLNDILIVAPYNAQVNALRARLPGARVGTVDKFQGQEAPIVIISLATSTPEDAPRGMEFLYSRNRLNVATSRARCTVILLCTPQLLEPECRTPRQMRLANGYAALHERAQRLG